MSEIEIGRALFLKVRCAYIRTMAARGESTGVIVNACNLHDETQARLIAMTEPGFDDGTVNDEVARLSELAGLDALADSLAKFATAELAKQRDSALSKVAELERELAIARELALCALLSHRAPSWDALPPTFGDRFDKAADAFEATLSVTPQVSQEGGGNGET